MIKKLLFNKKENIVKRTYIWNFVANIAYSLQSALLLLIVTRCGNLDEAGIFAIIYTTTHMFASIGNYNMRNYQVSDAIDAYSFEEYWTSRLYTCILMVVVGCIYGIIYTNKPEIFGLIICFILYRVTDGIEDVIHGYVQKAERLDVASFAKSLRIIIATIVFCIVFVLTSNLLFASFTLLVASLLILILFTAPINGEFSELRYRINNKNVFRLLCTCMPLCISAFLQNYIVNAPKYAIDRVLTDDVQAIFNVLFMPIFSINVLSMFIFNPVVADMGKWWINKDFYSLKKSILKQVMIVSIITCVISVVGYLIGCEVLGALYGINLVEYKKMFSVLLLFGGVAALATYVSVVVTIMRKQSLIIVAYVIAAITSLLFSDKIVAKYEMLGANLLYGILMLVVVSILSIVVLVEFKRKERVVYEQ